MKTKNEISALVESTSPSNEAPEAADEHLSDYERAVRVWRRFEEAWHGRIVADCQGCDIPGACGEVGTDEAKANARLISAAPDLLDALELLMNQYDSSPDFIMGGNLTNEPFLMARAAISKATGKGDA